MEQRLDNFENWQKWLLRGFSVSLAGVLAFAFWLGTISNEVSNTKQISQKIYSAVLEDPEGLVVRTRVIEHRLDELESRVTKVESRLDSMDTKLYDMNLKLDLLLSRGKVRGRR
jgi:hypothetical protein